MSQKISKLSFQGNGGDLFQIQIVNFILTIITLGFYYPWAKAKKLQYLYSNTTFEDHPFAFTGTGKEMFRGFVRAVILFILIYGSIILFAYLKMAAIGLTVFYVGFIFIVPLAIHGSYKYRMAKTVWKGIRFGYTGDRNELIRLFIGGILLTLVTFGIYGAWFAMDLRKYILRNIKVGDAGFVYKGEGSKYFWMNVGGYFLTIFTVGIYFFWWQKNLFEYFVNNLELVKEDKKLSFTSTATGGGFFGLMIVNLFIIIITLGIGFPWVIVRTMVFLTNNIAIEGELSLDELQQSQEDYSNATGDDVADMLDLGMVI